MREEASHLLVFLGDLGELSLNYALKLLLELILKDTHRGRHDMAQLGVKFGSHVELLIHLSQIDEVLRVGLLKLSSWDAAFKVDLLVLFDGLGEHRRGIRILTLKVCRISTSESIDVGFGLVEFLNADSQISDG